MKVGLLLISVLIIIFTGYYFTNNKIPVCTNDYLEEAKLNNNLENLEVCIKEHNVNAAIILSRLYAEGQSIKRDHHKAIKVIEKFAESGDSLALIQLAGLYSRYSSFNKENTDLKKAEKLYKEAVENNDIHSAESKIELARFYARNIYGAPNDENINLYLDWLHKIAEEGNIEAIHLLAYEYSNGRYLQKDSYLSIKWLQKAADLGDAKAFRYIGYYYASYDNFMGKPDYKEARRWFKKAADLGDDVAGKNIINPKPFGLEITNSTFEDFKKTFKHFKKSDRPNIFSGGFYYSVKPKYISLENVKNDVLFVFDKKEVLEAILIVFDRNQYSDLQRYLQSKFTPMFEKSKNEFIEGITEVVLTDGFELFSPLITTSYNREVCTLIYKSRAFSNLIYEVNNRFLQMKKEEKLKALSPLHGN